MRGGSTAGRRLWLARHGESSWNSLRLVQGQADAPGLTERGWRQAETWARRLAGRSVAQIRCSDLRRALESAQPLARALGLTVRRDPQLRERNLGAAEGHPVAQLPTRFSGVRDGVVVDADAAPPGGESIRELYARASRVLASVEPLALGGDVVLVTHGGMIRVLLALLDGDGPEGMPWPQIGNGRLLCRTLGVSPA